MANLELEKYISDAKDKKISLDVIKGELVKHGWPENDILDALNPKNSGITPPPPVPHFGMWVTFQYIILFICLYVSATSLGGILHKGVDDLIKDNVDKTLGSYGYGSYLSYFGDTLLKGYIAGIIVTFPIFAVLFLILKRQASHNPAIRNLRARKVLIYFTMVVTFIFMIGHLISTIYGFLGGNATLRSLAHLGVTFLVAGSIFVYLLNEVRADRKPS